MNLAGSVKSPPADYDLSQRTSVRAGKAADMPQRVMLLIVVGVAGILAVMIYFKMFHLNATPYHTWDWSEHSFLWTYALVLPCVIPFVIAQGLYQRRPREVVKCLSLICLTTFVMMITCSNVQHDPYPGPGRMVGIVTGRGFVFGYYYQARDFMVRDISPAQIVADYPKYLPSFELHPSTKPPGPILFESVILRTMRALHLADALDRKPAVVSGLLIAILATLGVPATYRFIKFFTKDPDAAFHGASYLALCPSLMLVFPQFDQTFMLLTVLLTILWAIAVKTDDLRFAAVFGLALGASEFITYLPTVLGIFLLGYAILKYVVEREGPWTRLMKLGCVAVGGILAFYVMMFAIFHYNPLASFHAAMANQARNMADMEAIGQGRHLPRTIGWDFYDFALGSGYISYLLVAFFFIGAALRHQWNTPQFRIAVLCIVQIALVALTGAVQCETARVWMFMLPMLALPIGLELSRWNFGSRIAVYMALLLLTAVICQRMDFHA